MWILQEIAQGQRNTPVLCGDLTTSWACVSTVFGLLLNCDEVVNDFIFQEVAEDGREMKLGELWANLTTVKYLQLVCTAIRKGELFPYNRVLQMGHGVFATDPRDKIYGLLALLHANLASRIPVDYTASVRRVYLDFVKATISHGFDQPTHREVQTPSPTSDMSHTPIRTTSLDVLCHSYSATRRDFPTWLPDWSTPRRVGTPLLFSYPFSTSGRSQPQVRFLSDDRILECQGIIYDRIDGLGHQWDAKISDPSTVTPSSSTLNPYGSKEAIQQAVWKTFVTDRDRNHRPLTTTAWSCLLAAPNIPDLAAMDTALAALRNLQHANIFR
ncbi:hypothetical protein F5Y10DRAFT_248266 [Nemania abortiva]|nr:hypothetical protein F5Y10DRAFT_248266 [Nemania abortiva]